MNKSVYILEFNLLELSKILMYKFWYDYVKPGIKPKYHEKAKLHYLKHIASLYT